MCFEEKINDCQEIMEKLLPLELMQLTKPDLAKQFVVRSGQTSRETVFKFYENANCKILYLTGNHSVASIADLLLELPPVFIFHADLSLTRERFDDLSKLNVLNAIYAVNFHEQSNLLYDNLYKIIETDLQFYWKGWQL
jgi:hypothetical protein